MTIPSTMTGLTLLQGGRSSTPANQEIDDLAPYLALREMDVPTPTTGLALIKVTRAAVNPSDVAFIKGVYGQSRVAGQAAGFEGTGTVVAGDTPLLGKRVSFFAAGSGAWADYCLAPIAMLIPLRDDLADEDAAGLIVNPVTAAAMFDIVRQDGADSFVVTAAGSQLGKFLMGLGRDHGIAPLAVVRRAEQAAHLRELGAAEVLVSSDATFADQMAGAFSTYGPRILLDAVAGPVSADLFFAMPDRARWICYGRLSQTPPSLEQMAQFIFRQKRIEGFWLSAWLQETAPEQVAGVIGGVQARFADGQWKTDISAVVPLKDAMQALPDAYATPDAKVLIAP